MLAIQVPEPKKGTAPPKPSQAVCQQETNARCPTERSWSRHRPSKEILRELLQGFVFIPDEKACFAEAEYTGESAKP